MSFELTGKLVAKYDTVQRTETFKVREFVLEKSEDVNGRIITNYIKFQCVQDRTAMPDRFNIGDEVKVQFNLKGSKWIKDGKEVRRGLDPSDTRKITRALQKNWVITFPQGTTKPFAPGRKGTAFLIRQNKPIVIPVVIQGFWRACNKKGLKFKKYFDELYEKFIR